MVTMAVAAGRLATLNPCLLGLNRLRPAELWQHIAPRQSMSQVHSYYPFCTGLYVLVLPEVIAEQIFHIYTLFVHGVATTMQVCSLNTVSKYRREAHSPPSCGVGTQCSHHGSPGRPCCPRWWPAVPESSNSPHQLIILAVFQVLRSGIQ